MRFQILNKLFFRSDSNSSRVSSSTPGAPLLAATRLYASEHLALGNIERLDLRRWHVFSLPPGTAPQLIESTFLMSRSLGSAPTSR
jgi:hypothetical protein